MMRLSWFFFLLLFLSQSAWAVFHASPIYSHISRQWTRQDGSSQAAQNTHGIAVARDSSSLYVVGTTDASFHGQTRQGSQDFIVVKYDSSGNFQWAIQDGGAPAAGSLQGPSGEVSPTAIGLDGSGNIYVAGWTTIAFDGVSMTGWSALFIVKYNSSGVRQWTVLDSAAGSAGVTVSAMAVTPAGDIHLVGSTNGSLDGQAVIGTASNYFLTKYDTNGALKWTIQDGTVGSSADPYGVAVDGSGNIFVCGTGAGLDGQSVHGGHDMFISKYNSSGALQWTVEDGGLTSFSYFSATGVALDTSGNVYATGQADDPFDGQTLHGTDDLFVTKYDTNGTRQWTVEDGGPSGFVYGESVSVDPSTSDVYVGGYTDVSMDGQTLTGPVGILLTKYNSSGSRQWTVIDSPSTDPRSQIKILGVIVDGAGNVIATGNTNFGLDGNSMIGSTDLLMTKYDSGGARQWTIQDGGKNAGGSTDAHIAVDSSGNIFVAGRTDSPLDGQTMKGQGDLIISKYSSTGTRLWTVEDGGAGDTVAANALALDSSGNVYVSGITRVALDGQTLQGIEDMFITKYDSNGVRQWTVQDGATSAFTELNSIAVDGSGNVYATGSASQSIDGQTSSGGYDLLITKYDTNGVRQWTVQDGGGGFTEGTGIAVDASGAVYVVGDSDSGIDSNSQQGVEDLIITKYDTNGVRQWTVQDGNTNGADVYSSGIALDGLGNLYALADTDTDTIDGQTIKGYEDYILTKYTTGGSRVWTLDNGVVGGDVYTFGVTTDALGNVYIVGETDTSLDHQVMRGDQDYFITKYNAGGTRLWTHEHGRLGASVEAQGVFVDSMNQVYISGHFSAFGSTGFDGQSQYGNQDLFITKY